MKMHIGCTGKKSFIKKLRKKNVGRVNTPVRPFSPYQNERWISDNGAFSYYLQGKSFDSKKYLRHIEKCSKHTPPIFAVIPDIVAGGERSLEYSLEWLSSGKLPSKWRWYLALQDGMRMSDVFDVADYIDGLFIGGTLKFKSTAPTWCDRASRFDLPVHFGRCGIHKRIDFAYRSGCDSIDSSFPLFESKRFHEFLSLSDSDGNYNPDSWKQGYLSCVI
jgi:hypothetical protein